MRIIELEQNTPEWLAWRHNGIGASDVASILGLNPWRTREQVLAEKVAPPGDWGGNEHTRRGKDREPVARTLYETLYGWQMTPVCAEHDDYPFIRASLDGIRADGKLVLEIKAPNEYWHRHTMKHGVPDWYAAQVQQQLFVSGTALAHFVSYRPDTLPPASPLIVLPVRPDPEFQVGMLDDLRTFWAEVLQARLTASLAARHSGACS